MLTFTPSIFFQYATCPHWVWRDVYGDRTQKGEIPELAQKLMEQGVLHETDFIKNLTVTAVASTAGEAAYVETENLMKQGTPLIYQGAIRAQWNSVRYQGRPDLLEKIAGQSRYGNYYYRPIDIKNSEDIKQNHRFQLTLYAMILEQMQGVFPIEAGIINCAKERLLLNLTSSLRAKTERKIAEILQVMAGYKPPLKLVSGCKSSPWFTTCVREAEAASDIALIYKLDSRALEALRAVGVCQLVDAATMDIAQLQKIPYLSTTNLERIQLQAQALLEKKIIWLQRPHIPTAPIKIYFDIEGDPLLQVQYLFGFWIVGDRAGKLAQGVHTNRPAGTEKYYVYFLAEQPETEEQMWQEFCAWARRLRQYDYVIYHYADYERSRTLGLANKYGNKDCIDELLTHFVDLANIVQQTVIFPLYFYSIKDIAKSKFLNYSWRHPKAGGAQSIFWYEKWLETGARQVLQDIVDYNEDDVVATEYLHHWLNTSA